DMDMSSVVSVCVCVCGEGALKVLTASDCSQTHPKPAAATIQQKYVYVCACVCVCACLCVCMCVRTCVFGGTPLPRVSESGSMSFKFVCECCMGGFVGMSPAVGGEALGRSGCRERERGRPLPKSSLAKTHGELGNGMGRSP